MIKSKKYMPMVGDLYIERANVLSSMWHLSKLEKMTPHQLLEIRASLGRHKSYMEVLDEYINKLEKL